MATLKSPSKLSYHSSPASPQKVQFKLPDRSNQEFHNERTTKLTKLFLNAGFPVGSRISENQLLDALDSFGPEPFDLDIAEHLLEKVPFHEDPQSDERFFVVRDFIETYIKAEYLLRLQKEEIQEELNEVYRQIEDTKKEYYKVTSNDELNFKANCLRVDVIEAVCEEEEYEPDPDSPFSIVLIADGYKYETEEINVTGATFNPVFDQTFHLRLNSHSENMEIFLRDQQRYMNDPDYSDLKCTINLSSYKDQLQHVSWLSLHNYVGQATKFKVHLVIQWQFSPSAHITERLSELDVIEGKVKKEKEFVEESLKVLGGPFAGMVSSRDQSRNQESVSREERAFRF